MSAAMIQKMAPAVVIVGLLLLALRFILRVPPYFVVPMVVGGLLLILVGGIVYLLRICQK